VDDKNKESFQRVFEHETGSAKPNVLIAQLNRTGTALGMTKDLGTGPVTTMQGIPMDTVNDQKVQSKP
jgi:hypothetical protein